MASALVLVIPDVGKPFEVYFDASYLGLGFMLMQEKKAVAYALRQLKVHEKNYPHSCPGVDKCGVYLEDLEALFVWCPISGVE